MPGPVALVSTSRAADGGFHALADLAAIAATLDIQHRIVGGHMVTILARVHGVADQVPHRETLDADFGATPEVIAESGLVQALRDRDYTTPDYSNRFVRTHQDPLGSVDLAIDVLAPTYGSGNRVRSMACGDLTVDAIPGLALALTRPAIETVIAVRLFAGGGSITTKVAVPDLASALCLKAFSYAGRCSDRDSLDLYRLMVAAEAAGLRPEAWPTNSDGRRAAAILREAFTHPAGGGLRRLPGDRRVQTRMRLLTRAIVPPAR